MANKTKPKPTPRQPKEKDGAHKTGKPRIGAGVQVPRRLALEDRYMVELRDLGRGSASAGVRYLVDFICRTDRGFRPTFIVWRDKNRPDFEEWRARKLRA